MKVIEVRIGVEGVEDRHLQMPGLGKWIAETIGQGLLADEYRFLGGSVYPLVTPKPGSIQIRETPKGLLVVGSGAKVLAKTRKSADRIKARLLAGEDIRQEDFAL